MNQCLISLNKKYLKRTIPLLSLEGIDPPHEEKIGALLGQSHNVTSHRVQILNCNTIFIPGFVFNQGNDPPGFIYLNLAKRHSQSCKYLRFTNQLLMFLTTFFVF